MNSSILQSSSNESPSSDIAVDSSVIIPSKRDIFLSTYNCRQRFSLPDSMMHYITKNPKNTKFYQKMVKSCKYFFIKNPILVIDCLYYDQNEWRTWIKDDWKNIDMNTILAKVWITDKLDVTQEDVYINYLASSIIPKIYQCDATYLLLKNQVISLNEFMFLCLSVEELGLEEVTVKNDNGTVVLFDKLAEQFPNVKEIYYTFTTPSNNISKNTFKEIWKIPHLSNYDSLCLINIPADFDIDIFYSFIKKNKNTHVALDFSDQISEEYKARLEAIIDEIIGAENHEYKPPCIDFPGLDEEKFDKLYALYFQ